METHAQNKIMTDPVSDTDGPVPAEPADAASPKERNPVDDTIPPQKGMDAEAQGTDAAEEAADPAAEAAASVDSAEIDAALHDLEAELGLEEDPAIAELTALREEFEALNDRHLRLAAEFNNYRRRVEQERTEVWGRAQADMVGRLIEVLDDLQRVAALDLTTATVEAIMEGIDLVERNFSRKLADVGVEIVDPQGGRFDPATMEAMMRVPTDAEEADDTVAQVFQKGYTLGGQLVRPARVSVFKVG